MKDLISKLRLKRNEFAWRFMTGMMFRHYRHRDAQNGGEGRADYPTVGILGDLLGLHESYAKAAGDLKVPYKIVDLASGNWLEAVGSCGCELFFVWPNPFHPAWKTMYDERIFVIERELGFRVYPRLDEIWIWESKRRMSYWLNAHGIAQPKTWVFYDYNEAIRFASKVDLPVVFKPDFGDCARGVRIVRSRRQAISLVRLGFSRGFSVEGHHPHDRIWGCVVFQKFIPDAREWRVIRIGDSLFAYCKGKKGDFHSGSKLVEYHVPPRALLDLVMGICEKGKFDCMSFDVLEDETGHFYTIELQTVFGGDPWIFQMMLDGAPGRYRLEESKGRHQYRFEKGIFCENDCCNLRMRDGILKHYGIDVGFWEEPRMFEKCIETAQTKYRHLVRMGS